MQKVSESLVGFEEESPVSPGKVNDLTRQILNVYRELRSDKQHYIPPSERPGGPL